MENNYDTKKKEDINMDINKDREKLFSKLYNFEYVCCNFDIDNVCSDFNIPDSYTVFKYMKELNSEKYKKPILKMYIDSEIKKLPINLIHNNENKYYEASMRFGPKVIFDYNYCNILIPKDCVSKSDAKYICYVLISFLDKIITSLDQNNLKTINDVIYAFNNTSNIAISNKLFNDGSYNGYIFEKLIPSEKIDMGPSCKPVVIKEHYEIYGRDSKGEFYICDLDRLGNHFNTPIYDNNWYILGLFIDGVLYRINSCNGKDEIIKR